MRRPISYIGQTVYDWLFTRPAQDNMVALGKLAAAVLGTTTMANGLAVTPTAHYLEYMDWADVLVEQPLAIKDGHAIVPDRPGNGMVWNKDAVARFRLT